MYQLFFIAQYRIRVRVMLFNATFNNISAISWLSVLLVEETGVPGENHRPAASPCETLSPNVVSSTPLLSRATLTTLLVIGTDCIGSYKSNYHTITTMMTPTSNINVIPGIVIKLT